MRRPRFVVLCAGLVLVALSVALPGVARANVSVDLYTIGAGSYLYARYGHSLLCVHQADKPSGTGGRCFDYGVPAGDASFARMAWASLRGQPLFVPVVVDESVVLRLARDQGRSIERQRLSLMPADATRLAERLETDVRERRGYAYDPASANCATQVRDRIDEAASGRLRSGPQVPRGLKFRELAEEGLSGRMGELTAFAFLVGPRAERQPTPWEGMFLPNALRDGVAERLGVHAEKVEERKGAVLPTSTAAGRITLFGLGVVLFLIVRMAGPRRLRASTAVVGLVLGTMALIAETVALVAVWPEVVQNWALAALLPTDLGLPWLRGRWLTGYVRARVAMVAALFLGEIVGVVRQPTLQLAVLVALPMLGILSAAREADGTRGARVAGAARGA